MCLFVYDKTSFNLHEIDKQINVLPGKSLRSGLSTKGPFTVVYNKGERGGGIKFLNLKV